MPEEKQRIIPMIYDVVFKSVLQKMKDMEIAEINNMGVKGTAIKIIDGVFLHIDNYID